MVKRDDQADDQEGDEWVIAKWVIRSAIELMCVRSYEGKPRADLVGGPWEGELYTWRSYQAAHKFKASHPELEGFMILNLSLIYRQAEYTRELWHKRIDEMARNEAAQKEEED